MKSHSSLRRPRRWKDFPLWVKIAQAASILVIGLAGWAWAAGPPQPEPTELQKMLADANVSYEIQHSARLQLPPSETSASTEIRDRQLMCISPLIVGQLVKAIGDLDEYGVNWLFNGHGCVALKTGVVTEIVELSPRGMIHLRARLADGDEWLNLWTVPGLALPN
jgi:hypothetical protein